MHKAPEFPGASLPGPLPELSPGPVGEGERGVYSLPQAPSWIFHAFGVKEGFRPFLSVDMTAQIIILE